MPPQPRQLRGRNHAHHLSLPGPCVPRPCQSRRPQGTPRPRRRSHGPQQRGPWIGPGRRSGRPRSAPSGWRPSPQSAANPNAESLEGLHDREDQPHRQVRQRRSQDQRNANARANLTNSRGFLRLRIRSAEIVSTGRVRTIDKWDAVALGTANRIRRQPTGVVLVVTPERHMQFRPVRAELLGRRDCRRQITPARRGRLVVHVESPSVTRACLPTAMEECK